MRALAAACTCTCRSPRRSGSTQARDLALALAARTPTMDPSPNQNLTDGLIRPPGSVHPSGGHQVLHGTLTDAHQPGVHRQPTRGAHRAHADCSPPNSPPCTAREQPGRSSRSTPVPGDLPRRSGARELAADYLRIARTGVYDTTRYRSPSEARQAVLDAAVWAGLTLPAVLARIENGTWPGLASFYTRYRHPRTRRKALLADWAKALAYVTAQQARKPTQSLVRNSPTSEPPSHGGAPPHFDQDQQRARGTPAEYQWIRTWWSALGLLEHDRYADRAGIGKRWVLRAIGRGRDENRVPVRRVRHPVPVDRDRAGPHHRRRAPAGAAGGGRPADRPDRERPRPGRRPVPAADPGRDHRPGRPGRAGRPGSCTRCGRCSGNSATPPRSSTKPSNTAKGRPERSFDLITRTGLSRTAVYEALETLAAWNLVEPRDGRWVLVAGTSLQQLAEQFGCADTVRALLNRHRDERARYRRALRIVDQHHVPALSSTEAYLWPPEPPPACRRVPTPLPTAQQ